MLCFALSGEACANPTEERIITTSEAEKSTEEFVNGTQNALKPSKLTGAFLDDGYGMHPDVGMHNRYAEWITAGKQGEQAVIVQLWETDVTLVNVEHDLATCGRLPL